MSNVKNQSSLQNFADIDWDIKEDSCYNKDNSSNKYFKKYTVSLASCGGCGDGADDDDDDDDLKIAAK